MHFFCVSSGCNLTASGSYEMSTTNIQECQIMEVLCHTCLYNHTDKYSHLCRAFLMVASVSEKLRCRLGMLDVSAFSRMECNELDFRRFD